MIKNIGAGRIFIWGLRLFNPVTVGRCMAFSIGGRGPNEVMGITFREITLDQLEEIRNLTFMGKPYIALNKNNRFFRFPIKKEYEVKGTPIYSGTWYTKVPYTESQNMLQGFRSIKGYMPVSEISQWYNDMFDTLWRLAIFEDVITADELLDAKLEHLMNYYAWLKRAVVHHYKGWGLEEVKDHINIWHHSHPEMPLVLRKLTTFGIIWQEDNIHFISSKRRAQGFAFVETNKGIKVYYKGKNHWAYIQQHKHGKLEMHPLPWKFRLYELNKNIAGGQHENNS